MIHSYPKIYNLGHRALKNLFDGPVTIEEKVDGSQFSFGDVDGMLICRSRNVRIELEDPGMFALGVDVALNLFPELHPGWVYRGEYLQKPKHNALAYDRVPSNHVIIWDIETEPNNHLSYADKRAEAERIGLEVVPVVYEGEFSDLDALKAMLERVSILGGQSVEGIVIKNYERFGIDGKIVAGKLVADTFKEVHRGSWRKANPTKGDIIDQIVDGFRTEARWHKAVQHLRDAGKLDGSPKDIGPLIKEAQQDILAECLDDIKGMLWKWAQKQIMRRLVAGLPEWYKQQLAESQFEASDGGDNNQQLEADR